MHTTFIHKYNNIKIITIGLVRVKHRKVQF